MNTFVKPLLLSALLSLPAVAQTVIHAYSGGESDSVSDGDLITTTIDAGIGSTNLTMVGTSTSTYSSSTFDDSSAHAYSFDGTGGLIGAADLSLNSGASFIMELRFNASSGTATHALIYNGNSGFRGIGLFLNGGFVSVLRGGVSIPGFAAYDTDVWNYAALVYDQGALTGYLNGTAFNLVSGGFIDPIGGDKFSIGSSQSDGDRFVGLVDDVRISTFAIGTFTESMLSYAIPEPASYAAIAGLATLGLATTRRRRRLQ